MRITRYVMEASALTERRVLMMLNFQYSTITATQMDNTEYISMLYKQHCNDIHTVTPLAVSYNINSGDIS